MKRLTVPIYESTVYLVRTQADLDRLCEKHGIELPDKRSDGITIQFEKDGIVQFVIGWMTKDVSVLAHEAVHLAQFILLRAGMDPRDSNGEAMAYIVGWAVDKVMRTK